MVDEIKSKRVFFLANGALLATWKTGYCCVKGKLFCRMPFYHQFSHVGFLIQPERSTVQFYSENKRQLANSWPLMDHDEDRHHGGFTTTLEPRAFFTTSEYAQFPPRASALLTPLIEELQSQWKRTFETAQQHLSDMRISVLKARGLNGDLIQALLNDSLLWDQVEQASRKQISDLKEFRQRFFKSSTLREPATQPSERTLPEDTQDSEESDLQAFGLGVERLQSSHEMELKALKEMSQSLIQLEFNLTSIAEAQLSRSNNMSMKRLSWITFIFLPLMFVASVFGMNIDALASNPHWHWPVIIAIPTALVAFSVVFVLRWMEHRKPLIPDLEEGEQEGRHDRKMEGWASRLRMTWFSAGRRKRD
ncbi:hypothetical protein CGGC5_v012687 [Colletotrichum fructicola Nara gc5]|uniref:Uncharacterized protein n=1 Tax=Colletotrichum fructicola (strain Nara gc5) TaxID=1213859 RepID=A0A7J6IS60_COLFN|nr:hypothetical protein CGGC5_v012687 [Colletotrichum fructicola Nara gc5]KAF5490263.1 hypothetical protein CGCF413_v011618 [Colletotrichum fructicola]